MRILHLTARRPNSNATPLAFAFLHGPKEFEGIARGTHTELAYIEAAYLDSSDKEWAFERTNSVSQNWTTRTDPDVRPTGKSLRSTSVGDIMVHDWQVYAVAPTGFIRLDMNPEDVRSL